MIPDSCRLYDTTIDWLCPARVIAYDVTGRSPRGKDSPGKRFDANRRMNGALRRWSIETGEPSESVASPIPANTPPDFAPQAQPDPSSQEGEPETWANQADAPPIGECYEREDRAGEEAESQRETREKPPEMTEPLQPTDYYEVLQVSRNADMETIHRVYRIMAARFHPDNTKTGDAERFHQLTRAYRVLSDPARRVQYDAALLSHDVEPLPVFQLKDFVDGVDGEINRRLGVLALLYHRRRMSPAQPGISVLDLEKRMAFPREYLNFTLWYLRTKGFVRLEENSDYGVTAEGVDYVEANSAANRVIRELLTEGSGAGADSPTTAPAEAVEIRKAAASCDGPDAPHSESCAA